MQLELITLSGEKLSEEVYEVTIPTVEGDISVFPGHTPVITVAKSGVLYVRVKKSDRDEQREAYALSGGVVQVDQKLVRVLVDEADHADDLVAKDIEAALERAKKLREEAKDAVSISEAEALMNRATIRLKVANLRRLH